MDPSGNVPLRTSRIETASGLLHKGVGYALASAVLFGASAPFAKRLVESSAPQLLAGMLYLGSGSGLALLWLWRRQKKAGTEASIARRDLGWLAGAIAFGGILAPLSLMFGLVRTAGSTASLLLNLEGVFTALLAWFVFHENFDRRIATGMLVIVAGSMLLSWQGEISLTSLTGPLAIVAACLCWAIDNNLTQKVSAGDPVQIAMLKGLIAGSVNVAIALTLHATWPAPLQIAGALSLGFVGYGLSLVLFVYALRHLGTARTGAYYSVAPFVGAAVALTLFHEPLTLTLIVAAILMGIGVWLHLTERHAHEHQHEVLEHEHPHVHAPADDHHLDTHIAADAPVTDPTPHTHPHRHDPLLHQHPHYPDIHHRHGNE